MRIFITSLYINAQNLTEHSVDEIVHHVHHKGQSREFTLEKSVNYFLKISLNKKSFKKKDFECSIKSNGMIL